MAKLFNMFKPKSGSLDTSVTLNIHPLFIRQTYCWSREKNFLYLANAKAGSSNIKRALISSVLDRAEELRSAWSPHGDQWWDDAVDLTDHKLHDELSGLFEG